ncbi:septation protein SepH [Thalassiella azotivora]
MQDLHLVGVDDDGEHVLLTGADGQRYRLAIDEPLRAAVRRDRARLGQLQIQVDGALRPREVQARIRAGESAEDVAASAGVPVEHVRRYEGPVLAEREHVARVAQQQPVRAGGQRGPVLSERVDERLAARGATAGDWDAWRRDDGTWMVQLSFRTGSKDRRARWVFDVARSTLEPVDDEARWLTAAEEPVADGPLTGRRLAAVRERVYDVEADGGVREAGGTATEPTSTQPTPTEPVPEPAVTAAGGTVDLLEELRGRRGRRQPVATPEEGDDLLGELGLPPAAHPPASRPDTAHDAEILALPDPAAPALEPARDRRRAADDAQEATAPAGEASEPDEGPDDAAGAGSDDGSGDGSADDVVPGDPAAGGDEPATTDAEGGRAEGGSPRREPAVVPAAPRRQSGKGKARRPSVPSWDEIVFGARKD